MAKNVGQFTTEANLGSLQTGARFYIWDGTLTGIDRSIYTTWGNLQGYLDGRDSIHDNVAGEIFAITEKASPTNDDWLLIEDSADSYSKKRVSLGNVLSLGGVSYEESFVATASQTNFTLADGPPDWAWVWINGAAQAPDAWTITSNDIVVDPLASGDDLSVYYIKTNASGGGSGGGIGNDENAIHTNITGEFALVPEKTVPVAGDWLLIEDSEDSYSKKRLALGSLANLETSAYEESFVATSAQTNFTLADGPATWAWVWVNGAAQDPSAWAITANDIVIDPLASGDNVDVYYIKTTNLSSSGSIDDLTDVTITTGSDFDMLRYNNGTSQWVNESAEDLGLSKAPLLSRARRIIATTINNSGQYSQVVYNNNVTYDFTYNGDSTINTKSDGTTTWQAVYSSGDFSHWNVI